MFGLKDDDLNSIKNILKTNHVDKAIIFGSRAKGNYKKGSDVDIAIIGDERKVAYCLNEESNLAYFFDIVNLEKIQNTSLMEHINRVGKVVL